MLHGIGLDLMTAIQAPHDEPNLGCSGIAKGHRRAAVGFHLVFALGQITHNEFDSR